MEWGKNRRSFEKYTIKDMIVLILFAFIAGVVTVLSPCILPILPIVLSSSVGGEKSGYRRPFGVVIGFVASFTFFTLFLSTIVRVSGISPETLRLVAVVIIAGFGLTLVVPYLRNMLEELFSVFGRFAPKGTIKKGFIPGLFMGFSLGLLWTPCVGPILASVISLSLTGSVTFNALLITLAYSLGTALPMFAIMWGGRALLQKVPWLLIHAGKIQQVFGVLMILTALAILFNVDRTFQTFILKTFPQYGVGLTKIEDRESVRKALDTSGGKEQSQRDSSGLLSPKEIKAPEIISEGVWINSEALLLEALRGKVVIIDFWTYSCINCQRTLPYLKKWDEKYRDEELVIIGVHAPEFEFEKSEKNVRQAVEDFGIKYPVVQDNNFATWRAYQNRYWPAKYFIDAEGYVRYTHFGEGEYEESERVIQELLKEAGAQAVMEKIDTVEVFRSGVGTPETYLGYGRGENNVSPEKITPDVVQTYSAPSRIPSNKVSFSGEWVVTKEHADPKSGSSLYFNYSAQQVFLVMRPKGDTAHLRVYVDETLQYFGEDNKEGVVTVDADRLYKLIQTPKPGRHTLRLEFLDDNAEVYAFTFG